MGREELNELLAKLDTKDIPMVIDYINELEEKIAKYQAAYDELIHELQTGMIAIAEKHKNNKYHAQS